VKKPKNTNQLALRFPSITPLTDKERRDAWYNASVPPTVPEAPPPAIHFTMRGFMPSTPGLQLDAARAVFRDRLDDGTSCPCCGRYAKRYRRTINGTMAGALAILVKRRQERIDWVRAEEVGKELRKYPAFERVSYPHGEIGKLAFPAWGLVESKPNTDDVHKKHTGSWRATARGEAFVLGNLVVPRYLHVYDNHVDAVSTDTIGFAQCFKTEFSYLELMR
jgi:hypothetical protein